MLSDFVSTGMLDRSEYDVLEEFGITRLIDVDSKSVQFVEDEGYHGIAEKLRKLLVSEEYERSIIKNRETEEALKTQEGQTREVEPPKSPESPTSPDDDDYQTLIKRVQRTADNRRGFTSPSERSDWGDE